MAIRRQTKRCLLICGAEEGETYFDGNTLHNVLHRTYVIINARKHCKAHNCKQADKSVFMTNKDHLNEKVNLFWLQVKIVELNDGPYGFLS